VTEAAPSDAVEARVPIEALIESLSRPGAIVPGEAAEVVQTHISVVFLAGDRALKVKKPMRLWGLLDYGTVALRKHWCEEEVRLNRRLAPEVYRGVVPITRRDEELAVGGDGQVVEHAVEMTRIPRGVTLRERLEAGTLTAKTLAEVGRRLAAFAAEHPLDGQEAHNALPSAFAYVVRRNLRGSAGGVPATFPAAVHDGLRARLVRRIAAARGVLRRRVAGGRAIDGHGDIRLEHVLLQEGRIEVIDCCEFSERLRHVDALSDAAFLSMDLAVRGRPDLAVAFERAWLEAARDPDGALLLPLYRAYRAQVRAMVDEQTLRKPELTEDVRRAKALGARRCMALAWSNARAGAPAPIVVMRGAAGTGKSWLASALAPWLRAEVVRSDVVRKALLGLAPTDRPSAAARKAVYGPEMHARTYASMLERARTFNELGRPVLLDATYVRRDSRDAVRSLAHELGAPFAIVDVTCDPAVVARRIRERAARDDDASDAGIEVHEAQVREMDPLGPRAEAPFATTFDTEHDAPEEAVLPLLEVLEAQVDARTEPLGPDPLAKKEARR
jgi:hypothetical protein